MENNSNEIYNRKVNIFRDIYRFKRPDLFSMSKRAFSPKILCYLNDLKIAGIL